MSANKMASLAVNMTTRPNSGRRQSRLTAKTDEPHSDQRRAAVREEATGHDPPALFLVTAALTLLLSPAIVLRAPCGSASG